MTRKTALVMIVRNEAARLARCLDSAAPWVDAMVVLDTGSTDGTPALAEAHGAQVGHFAWIDDFAAARNAALALSDADWNLVLDADERLVDGFEQVTALRDAMDDALGLVRIDSVYDNAGHEAVSSAWVPRLLPRGVRYEGRVHEQPVGPPALPRRRLPIVLDHDGYLPERLAEKRGRNGALLRLALQDHPDDAYLHYQWGKEQEVVLRDHAGAAAAYERALARMDPSLAWRHDVVVRLLFCLKCAKRFEDALALAQHEMPHWRHSPDFSFAVGDLLLDWAIAEPARAPALLPAIEQSWLRCLEIGEQPELEGAVHGRGSFLAAHNLHAFHLSLGDEAKAAAFAALRTAQGSRQSGAAHGIQGTAGGTEEI